MARNPLGSTPSISGSAFAKATELQQRLWFTLGALLVYRLGTYIPVPGIDPAALSDLFNDNSGGLLGMFNMMAGGALGRMTIFALSVFPYITASIITQLLTAVSPQLEALKKEGETGRKKNKSIYQIFNCCISYCTRLWLCGRFGKCWCCY